VLTACDITFPAVTANVEEHERFLFAARLDHFYRDFFYEIFLPANCSAPSHLQQNLM
jgi:hypothetical protein